MNISIDHRVARGKKTASRIIEGEAIIITPEDRTLHILNKVGTRIWETLGEEKTIGEIVNLICLKFKVDKDNAQTDVLEFLQKLYLKQILDVRPSGD